MPHWYVREDPRFQDGHFISEYYVTTTSPRTTPPDRRAFRHLPTNSGPFTTREAARAMCDKLNSISNNEHVGFTGTRQGLSPYQTTILTTLITGLYISTFHHGDCVGADAEAHTLIRNLRPSVRIYLYPPLESIHRAHCEGAFHSYTPQEYIRRNHDIVRETGLLIACPATPHEVLRSGTWATIRYARTKHRTIYIIPPEEPTP